MTLGKTIVIGYIYERKISIGIDACARILSISKKSSTVDFNSFP